MKLYKIKLGNSTSGIVFYVLVFATSLTDAEATALASIKAFGYDYNRVVTTELLTEEGQYGKPEILLVSKSITQKEP